MDRRADEEVLHRHWGQNERSCDIGPGAAGDGVIDEQDLTLLAAHLGTHVNDPTLVSHWPLDETDGTVAHDIKGNQNATLVGGPIWQPEGGVVGGVLEFDGLNDCVKTFQQFDPAEGPFWDDVPHVRNRFLRLKASSRPTAYPVLSR